MKTRTGYDEQLEKLSEQLVRMGGMAAGAVEDAVRALREHDMELAARVQGGDEEIDRMERSIEHDCLSLLLRQQPVAADLRKVSCAIKMITDIERIGDAAGDMAEIMQHIAQNAGLPQVQRSILTMADTACGMVEGAIRAYVQEDLELAAATIAQDDVVDAEFLQVKSTIATALCGQACEAGAALDQLMIAKYLERVGDHAVNICEWVQFYKTGVHKREKIV